MVSGPSSFVIRPSPLRNAGVNLGPIGRIVYYQN
jgi:hypothetical protein